MRTTPTATTARTTAGPASTRARTHAAADRIPAELRARRPLPARGAASTATASDRAKRTTQRWARWLHVYTSMVALVVVLFFGLTGLSLNHPEWTFGTEVTTTTDQGVLGVPPVSPSGDVDFLSISEHARDVLGVHGTVESFSATAGRAAITYTDPAYRADLVVDVAAGTYDLAVEQQGWVAAVNDLHRGSDTGSAWRWVIDAAAAFLVVVAVSGLAIQLVMRKRRSSALVAAGAGGALLVSLIAFVVR